MKNTIESLTLELAFADNDAVFIGLDEHGTRLVSAAEPHPFTLLPLAGSIVPDACAAVLLGDGRPVVLEGTSLRLAKDPAAPPAYLLFRTAIDGHAMRATLWTYPALLPVHFDAARNELVVGDAGAAAVALRPRRFDSAGAGARASVAPGDKPGGWESLPSGVVADMLAAQFAPEARLHRDEKFYPSSIAYFLGYSFLREYKFPFWTDHHDPSFELLVKLSNNVPEYRRAVADIMVNDAAVKEGERARTTTTNPPPLHVSCRQVGPATWDLMYWFFYPFNGCPKQGGCFGFCHFGDWEHFTVRITRSDAGAWVVDGVFGSAHGDGMWRRRPEYNGDPEPHPVVYVAFSSHAMYLNNGDEKDDGEGEHYRGILNNDFTDRNGCHWRTWLNVTRVQWAEETPTLNHEDWIKFTGLWGSPDGPCVKKPFFGGDPGSPTESNTYVARKLDTSTQVVNVGSYDHEVYVTVPGSRGVAIYRLARAADVYAVRSWIVLPPEADGQEARMAFLGPTVWVGVNGFLFPYTILPDGTLSPGRQRVNLPGRNNETSVLAHDGRLFAAAYGRAFEIDTVNYTVLHTSLLPGAGQKEVRLHAEGKVLWAGVEGRVYKLDIAGGLNSLGSWRLDGYTGVTNVLASEGNQQLWAAVEGVVYQLNPDNADTEPVRANLRDISHGEVRLALSGPRLIAGINGWVVSLIANGLHAQQRCQLDDRKGVTDVLVTSGSVLAAPEGRLYQLSSSGTAVVAVNSLPEIGDRQIRLATDLKNILAASEGHFFATYFT